jgi:hypothetical protein
MAARTRKSRHDDFTRDKIKTSQLINRLTKHAFGTIELSQTQVNAIRILLGKSLPDLAAISHSGPNGEPLESRNLSELSTAEILLRTSRVLEKLKG